MTEFLENETKDEEQIPGEKSKPGAFAQFAVTQDREGGMLPSSALDPAYQTIVQGTFGGDGSDGALEITSGTTTINCAGAKYVVKNYTTVSITGTAKLTFSNPHSTGTIIVIKCKGAFTLTSSSTAGIDVRGMGAAGGIGGTGALGTSGVTGTTATGLWSPTFNPGNGASGTGGAGGAATAAADLDVWTVDTGNGYKIARKAIFLTPGSGGGGGAAGNGGASTDYVDGAAGGNGGGALYIEVGGYLTFTGTIDVSGSAGGTAIAGVGTVTTSIAGGGGGGGGACGMFLLLYNGLTANTGTIVAKGGAGGDGSSITSFSNNGSPVSGGGGGGAAAYGGLGATGGNGVAPASVNSNGAGGSNATVAGSGAGGGSGAAGDANSGTATGGGGGSAFATSVVMLTLLNTEFA